MRCAAVFYPCQVGLGKYAWLQHGGIRNEVFPGLLIEKLAPIIKCFIRFSVLGICTYTKIRSAGEQKLSVTFHHENRSEHCVNCPILCPDELVATVLETQIVPPSTIRLMAA